MVEKFKFITEVELVDANKVPIKEGSVLRSLNDDTQGVVTKVIRESADTSVFSRVGDICIQTSAGSYRHTNKYSNWVHIPHNEQTYQQRFKSWKQKPYLHNKWLNKSKDEGLAIEGIMNLLPDNIVNWDCGPWPDSIEDALQFMVDHLTKNKNED